MSDLSRTAERAQLGDIAIDVTRVLLQEFEARKGRSALERIWDEERFGVPLATFADAPSGRLVPAAVVNAITARLVREIGEPDFLWKVGVASMRKEALGNAYHLLKSCSTPALAYQRVVVSLNLSYNRSGRYSIRSMQDTALSLSFATLGPVKDTNACTLRRARLAMVPTLWGLPPARIEETQCEGHGASSCEYRLSWRRMRSRRWVLAAGVALGALCGIMNAALGGGAGHLSLVGALAAGGLSTAGWLESRKRTIDQDQGLASVLQETSRRNDEIEAMNRQLHESNAKLETTLAERKELDALKTEFLQDVNHELRTPLTLILLSLDSVGLEELSPRARDHLMAIHHSATRLLKLIDHLLDFSKLNTDRRQIAPKSLELEPFLRALVTPFTAFAREKGITISVEGAGGVRVMGDLELLDRVFQNLLANAVRFTPSGKIELKISQVDEWVEIKVSDTGIGIASGDLAKVLEGGGGAEAGARRGESTGLGMTQQIVALQGGTIEVSSESGRGTTVTVRLPRGGSAPIEIAPLVERRSLVPGPQVIPVGSPAEPAVQERYKVEEPKPPVPHPGPQMRTVLVVEDEVELRSYIGRVLRPYYRVLEAEDGEEGLQRVREDRPDVVLSDVMMPKKTGTQLIQALRANPETADLPVILLTALRGQEDKLAGLQSGANDYVVKPFAPSELLARIETQLRLRDSAASLATNERLATMGLLTSGFAHEVRNPLNALLNVIEPIRQSLGATPDLETARSLMDLVEECGQRVRHLSETLLAFARPGNRSDMVDVKMGLEATLRVLSWKANKNVSVTREYESDGWVMGDAGALNQVWLNLIDNAMRAVQHQGSLTVRMETCGDELWVSVIDSGPGIKPEDLKRLFQPFFSTRPAGEGTGLGLALCRRIVASHGGHIEVKTELGVGTRFVVHLPLPQREAGEQAIA